MLCMMHNFKYGMGFEMSYDVLWTNAIMCPKRTL
jgi:hypothetical protein